MERKGQIMKSEMLTNFGTKNHKDVYGRPIDGHGNLIKKPKASSKNVSTNIFDSNASITKADYLSSTV